MGVDTGAARKAATRVGFVETERPGEALVDGALVDGVFVDATWDPAARRYCANRVSAASNWLLLTNGKPDFT